RALGGTYPLSFTISNVGDGDLELSDVAITGSGAGAFQTDLTAGTVAPGGQLSVSVAFAPTEAAAYSAALTFSTNDVSQPTVTIALSGYGVFAAPHVHLVEGSHDYGPVRVDVGPTV